MIMKVLYEEEFQRIVEAGYETRNLEFKPGFLWTDDDALWLREKVIQTMLGMANTRDGGSIVIGVNERDGKLEFTGVSDDQLNAFVYDEVKGAVDGYASPSLSFDMAKALYQGAKYVVISVSEFDEIPIISRDDGGYTTQKGDYLLRRGDIYVRSQSGPAGTRRVTETEMREIIEMAIDKGQQKLRDRGWKFEAGKDEELFIKQRKGF